MPIGTDSTYKWAGVICGILVNIVFGLAHIGKQNNHARVNMRVFCYNLGKVKIALFLKGESKLLCLYAIVQGLSYRKRSSSNQ